ncbi:uncharacterized protein LOC108092985 [Drosophila ficusphila]|uniref:uncharacterized protein LOC108092985 n=1 Tax=Drosophila ficusphila TaxID=30025 RepID=UPI0007E6CD11|nr:uncharacterized protein LOC108092985 [Drosophila ficusphila]
MSLLRWRDPNVLHTLNIVRGIRTGAKVANSPRQRNRLRRQAENRSARTTDKAVPLRFQKYQLDEHNPAITAIQEPTSYAEYMDLLARMHEKQIKLEEDVVREEMTNKKANQENETRSTNQIEANKPPNETPLILCFEDVIGLRQFYIMDDKESNSNASKMYDDDGLLHETENEDLDLSHLQMFEGRIPLLPLNDTREIEDFPEDCDFEENGNPDSNQGKWVRRVMEFLRFRRLS